ncbi:G-protein coupled receptor frpr-1, partial [Biomphalaria pfeifferi]
MELVEMRLWTDGQDVLYHQLRRSSVWCHVGQFAYIEYTTIYAGYVTFSLAAFLSVERFLCVWKPFISKSLLTPTTIFLSVVIISIGTFGAYVVVYFAYTIKFEYSQTFNTTVAIYVFSEFHYQKLAVFMVYYQVQAILIPAISFILMSIFSLAT